MFATLVLALPSASSGGELVVRHKDQEIRFDLSNEDPGEIAFAAFYSDCVHEVLPLTAGYRAVLVFNLIRQGTATSMPPEYPAEGQRIHALLQTWGEQVSADAPEKLIYPLEHAYSSAELAFARLKGADAAAAGLLTSVAPRVGCDVHLALVSIKESGSAEYRGDGRHDEYEALGVLDRAQRLIAWRRPDGGPVSLDAIPFRNSEISPSDALADLTPDEQQFSEATGNEGASFERTYRRAALVLWPQHRRLALIQASGPQATVPYLESLAARWLASGEGQESAVWLEAHALSVHVLTTWPGGVWGDAGAWGGFVHEPLDRSQQRRLPRLLAALAVLQDGPGIVMALGHMAALDGHEPGDQPAILAALARLPLEQATRRLESILVRHARHGLDACSTLLKAAVEGPFAAEPGRLTAAAKGFIAVLPGDPASVPRDLMGARRAVTPDLGVLAELMGTLERINAALPARMVDHMLAWPQVYGLDGAVVPLAKHLREQGTPPTTPALSRLLAVALAHLESRVTRALEGPRDWVRASDCPAHASTVPNCATSSPTPCCRCGISRLASGSAGTWKVSPRRPGATLISRQTAAALPTGSSARRITRATNAESPSAARISSTSRSSRACTRRLPRPHRAVLQSRDGRVVEYDGLRLIRVTMAGCAAIIPGLGSVLEKEVNGMVGV